MFKFTLKFALLVLISLLLSTPSFAQDQEGDTKWYFGAGGGTTSVDTGVTNLTGAASLDDTSTGWKIFAGYQINKYLGVEAGYADLGEASLTGNNGDTFVIDGTTLAFTADGAKVTAEAKTILVEALVMLPLGDMTGNNILGYFTPFVKLGVGFWTLDYSASASNVSQVTTDDDGTGVVFGGGLNINIIRNLAVRVEYERFSMEEDVDLFSGSVIFRF